MKKLLAKRYSWVVIVSVLAVTVCTATWVLAALRDQDAEVEELYDWGLHKRLAEQQALGLQDLADHFCLDQYLYNFITPPSADFVLYQPGGLVPILDLKAFPDSFIDGLAGTVGADGIRRFPVWIYEDAASPGREIVIETVLEGKVVARIKRAWDYSPDWFALERHPELYSYDAWYRDWLLAGYDPARIVMRYDLLVGEDDLIKLVWKASIEAARRAEEEEEEGGGMMRASWEGGSVSNLQFVAIDKTTNGTIELTIAWPEDGLATNMVDFFACTNLMVQDWGIALTTNVNLNTNCFSWVDEDSTNYTVRFYDCWTHDDSDGDGISDGREKRIYGTDAEDWDTDGDGVGDGDEVDDETDPLDEDDPPNVKGSVIYTGRQTGTVWVVAVTSSNSWSTNASVTLGEPGAYQITKLFDTNYWLKAYVDSDGDGNVGTDEAWGHYINSIVVTAQVLNVNITLTDPDNDSDNLPDWWEMLYFDDLDETASGDPDGDNLVNSDEYTEFTDPTDADTDDDNMGDGAEIANSLSPTTSNTYYSLPFAEGFETNTVNPSSYYLRGQNGWSDSPAYIGMIQNTEAQDGDYGLQIFGYESQPRVHHYFGAIEHDVVWVDLWEQPLLRVASDAPSLDNAASTVFYVNTNANVVVRNGTSWETVTNHPAIGEETWVRFTTKQNFASETWDLWLEGQEIATNLDFAASAVEFSRFRATGGNTEYAYVDSLLISTAHPPNSVSGMTTYSGGQTGEIVVVAVSASNAWDVTYSTSLSTDGAYQVIDMPDWSACWMKAFRDSDGDEVWDTSEAWGAYISNPISLASAFDVRNADITLTDPDADGDNMPDWWEDEHGLSATNSADASSDPDSDGLNNLAEYQASTDPNDKDSDGDGLVDGTDGNTSTNSYPQGADADVDGWVDGEADAAYGCNPILFDTDADGLVDGSDGLISVANYPTGTDSNANGYVDGEVDYGTSSTNADTDADGCLDGWEVAHGYDPLDDTDPALTADPDQDGLTNLEEAQNNTDPEDGDTDDDSMGDWAEVANSLSPTVSNTFCTLPFSEGFETNTTTAGSLNEQNGWTAWPTNRALVVETNAQSGTQALQLGESYQIVGAEHFIAAHGETNVWIDFYMQVDPANTVHECRHPDVSEELSWPPSLFVVNDRSQVVAYDGSGTGTWETASNTVVSASGYHRYTIKQDFSAGTWDLYFDGTNVLNEMGFQNNGIVEFSRFSITGQWIGETYLDSVSVGTSKPSGLTP